MVISDRMYLWINLCDLSTLGSVGGLGSPLMLMIREDLGDKLFPGVYYNPRDKVDEMYVVVESSDERCTAIREALEMIGQRKMKRRVRTRTTAKPPGKTWRWIEGT